MADINTEDLQRSLDELTRTLNGLGSAANTGTDRFAKAGDSLFKVKGAGAQATASLDALGAAAKRLGSQLYKGEANAASYADAAESAADAVGKFALVVGGPWIKAFAVAGMLAVKYFAASAKQADKLYKGFQDLQKVGGATSQGFTDIQQNLRDFRLGIDDIDKLVGLIGQNAPALARFQGNVADGAKAVGAMARGITRSDLLEKFMNMGISLDEINESAFAYAALQSRTGALQKKTTEEATRALTEYIKEQDLVTKLTGANRKEQEEARNRAMAIDAFRREQEQAIAGGTEAERKRAEEALKTFNILYQMGPEGKKMAEGFAMMRKGFVTEGPALAMAMVSGGEAQRIAMDDTLDAAKKAELIVKSVAKGANELGGTVADVNQFSKTFGGLEYGGIMDADKMATKLGDRLADLTQKQGESNEDYVKRMTAMGISNMNARDNMQDFVKLGVGPATAALQGLAAAADRLTRFLPGAGGLGAGEKAGAAAMQQAKKEGAGFFGRMSAGASAFFKESLGIKGAPEAPSAGAGKAVPAGAGAIKGVLESGKGFITVETADGKQRREGGTRAWRNNNPGNIEFGNFAKSMGAIGSDGRFAVFPTLDMGNKAKESLLFGPSYSGLTIPQAISRYAPSNENDTRNYINQILGATGASPYTRMADLSEGQRKALLDTVSRVEGFREGQVVAARAGGVFSGPKSGYPSILHGTEAVIPLPDGRSIPVSMPDLSGGMDRQISAMGEQIVRLDEMVSLMRRQIQTSEKILQVSQS